MKKINRLIFFLLFILLIMGSSFHALAGDKKDEGIYRRTTDSFWSLTYKVGGVFKEGYKSIAGYFRAESPKIKEHGREIKEEIKKTNENIGKAIKETGKEIKEKNERVKKELKKK
jgi:gas vesicle protein